LAVRGNGVKEKNGEPHLRLAREKRANNVEKRKRRNPQVKPEAGSSGSNRTASCLRETPFLAKNAGKTRGGELATGGQRKRGKCWLGLQNRGEKGREQRRERIVLEKGGTTSNLPNGSGKRTKVKK